MINFIFHNNIIKHPKLNKKYNINNNNFYIFFYNHHVHGQKQLKLIVMPQITSHNDIKETNKSQRTKCKKTNTML